MTDRRVERGGKVAIDVCVYVRACVNVSVCMCVCGGREEL